MSSIAYNLSKKLEWMARRLRRIDDVGDIMDWIKAMTAINSLLKDTDNDHKDYRDDWKPWRQGNISRKGPKMDIEEVEPLKAVKKIDEKLMPPLRSPEPSASKELRKSTRSTTKGKTGIKDDGGKIFGDNDGGKKKTTLDPKAAVLEMLKLSKNQQEPNKRQVDLGLMKKKMNREIWRNDMLERVRKEKVPVEHWGDVQSRNFRGLIEECTPQWVRVAVREDLGKQQRNNYLYKELRKCYDKGCK